MAVAPLVSFFADTFTSPSAACLAMAPTMRRLATDVCALPPSSLFVSSASSSSSNAAALVSCDDEGRVATACLAACSCRRLVEADVALCLGMSSGGCAADDCREFTISAFASSTDLKDQAIDFSGSNVNDKDGPAFWVWIVIGVGVLLAITVVVFIVRCFKNRPTPGDNRTEIAEAERAVQWRKDQRRESVATTRTHGTNATEVSAVSSGSKRTAASAAAQHYGSPLTGTELAVSMYPDRVFSPISDESKDSSEYSQGVDEDGRAIHVPLVRTQDASRSESSDLDSMSSGLSVEDETSRSAVYPRKKSIEF